MASVLRQSDPAAVQALEPDHTSAICGGFDGWLRCYGGGKERKEWSVHRVNCFRDKGLPHA
ncbi:MAG: hypothetical protein ACK44Y_04045, partial [Novosphingobium sp.]